MLKFGGHFSWCGGSCTLTQSNLKLCIAIAEKELSRDETRLALWRKAPNDKSFAHGMEHIGPRNITDLLVQHVKCSRSDLAELKALRPGGQLLIDL